MNLRQLKNTPWEVEADGFVTVYFESKSPRDEIVKFCDSLKEKLLAKWDLGVLEHGSNWQGVDVNKEIASEVADIINYHCIFKARG